MQHSGAPGSPSGPPGTGNLYLLSPPRLVDNVGKRFVGFIMSPNRLWVRIQWMPYQNGRSVKLTTHLQLVPTLGTN